MSVYFHCFREKIFLSFVFKVVSGVRLEKEKLKLGNETAGKQNVSLGNTINTYLTIFSINFISAVRRLFSVSEIGRAHV